MGVYTKSVFESIVDVYDKSTKSSNNNVIEQVVNKYKELISLTITSLLIMINLNLKLGIL